ncbi:metal-dependent hydrolase [Paenibacillus agaridevorans]|uniref:Putative metal-dependent hydrolase PAT3040_02159 n=1 Tax=Paenibacillus agaridevorans TaxID=171404 RepID=A0A2R5EUY8_9BACL|nr:bacillithiol transferase BstA [Paenibacillus agaridevorans]GBG07603.1 metal-dependent hydrolase [Paenibacillus agaridevorans]
MDDRYPIGTFQHQGEVTSDQRAAWIKEIAELPLLLKHSVANLTQDQLSTPYRKGGWQVRQVVHHLADSHMNSLMRFKLALTEDHPTIRPYDEALWAELADSLKEPVDTSISLIATLHGRWVTLLESMNAEQFARTFYHPRSGETVPLDRCLGMYAWHGKHHLAQITSLAVRLGW